MACFITTILITAVLNIVLIFWIIIFLNLQKSSIFSHKFNPTKENRYDSRLWIVSDIRFNQTLFTDQIEGSYYGDLYEKFFHTSFRSMSSTSLRSFYDDSMMFQIRPKFSRKLFSNKSFTIQSFPIIKNNDVSRNSIRLTADGILELKIHNQLLFNSKNDLIQIDSDRLRITIENPSEQNRYLKDSKGSYWFHNLYTDFVHGNLDQDLRIESRTERLEMFSNGTNMIKSVVGEIHFRSNDDIRLESDDLVLMGGNGSIILANLNRDHHHHHHNHNHHHHHRNHHGDGRILQQENRIESKPIMAYQVCLCSNGVLFAIDETQPCQADHKVCGTNLKI
ncbi:hypothetical protein NH340_JMT07948 [Sarcoptes scabiei]|nr:hypothetical protein NH340_JMT07948 [Sarcoptes scabiei]